MTSQAHQTEPAVEQATSSTPSAMHIGEVAARTELSVRSLRHWEEVGLLHPSGRSEGGFRLYTEEDVERILLIRRMKPLGFTLEQMREVLADIETLGDPLLEVAEKQRAQARLDEIRTEAQERRVKLVRQVEMADEFIDLVERHAT